MAAPLQCGAAARISRLQTTGTRGFCSVAGFVATFAGYARSVVHEASSRWRLHELSLQLDHPLGADQDKERSAVTCAFSITARCTFVSLSDSSGIRMIFDASSCHHLPGLVHVLGCPRITFHHPHGLHTALGYAFASAPRPEPRASHLSSMSGTFH